MLPLSCSSVSDTKADSQIKSLARLIGDEACARVKVEKLRVLAQKIGKDGPQSEVEVFKALADPCRFTIIQLLREGELCVCEIMTALERPQSTTSHHLSILKEAGLIKERKVGKWSNYRLAEGAVIELINQARLVLEARERGGGSGKGN